MFFFKSKNYKNILYIYNYIYKNEIKEMEKNIELN
jgi:hypothetical protein